MFDTKTVSHPTTKDLCEPFLSNSLPRLRPGTYQQTIGGWGGGGKEHTIHFHLGLKLQPPFFSPPISRQSIRGDAGNILTCFIFGSKWFTVELFVCEGERASERPAGCGVNGPRVRCIHSSTFHVVSVDTNCIEYSLSAWHVAGIQPESSCRYLCLLLAVGIWWKLNCD